VDPKEISEPFKAGDTVRFIRSDAPLVIVATDGEHAWCRYTDGLHKGSSRIAHFSNLERVP